MLVYSDVLFWYLRGHEGAAQFLDGFSELALSAVTCMELVQGCHSRQEVERLKKDMVRRRATILPITEAISNRAVESMESHCLSEGLLLTDALIAATALEFYLTLASANHKHFSPISRLSLQSFKP